MTAWERRTRLWAFVFFALTLAVSALVALAVIRAGRNRVACAVSLAALTVGICGCPRAGYDYLSRA